MVFEITHLPIGFRKSFVTQFAPISRLLKATTIYNPDTLLRLVLFKMNYELACSITSNFIENIHLTFVEASSQLPNTNLFQIDMRHYMK